MSILKTYPISFYDKKMLDALLCNDMTVSVVYDTINLVEYSNLGLKKKSCVSGNPTLPTFFVGVFIIEVSILKKNTDPT